MASQNNVRQFEVIVPGTSGKGLVYPMMDGWKATELLVSLKAKGHTPIAKTTAHGITEDLSVEEMADIFSSLTQD